MKIFKMEPAAKIVEPAPQADGQPSVIYAGGKYIALLAGEFGDGTTGLVEIDHTDVDMRAQIAACIKGMVVEVAELDGLLRDLYQRMTLPNTGDVKAEAMRRILAIVPRWKQRNLNAQAAALAEKGRETWTPEELAAWNASAALWARVKAIREASDHIEIMDPMPVDIKDPDLWPEERL